MRTTILILIAFSFIHFSEANDEKKVKPAIKQVTVFLNSAQLTSTATTSIKAGTSDIVLEGLSPFIDPQSIQISGQGEFIIMSVKYSLNHLDPQKKSREMRVLEDSVEHIQMEYDILMGMKDVYVKEEQMILANQKIGGEKQVVSSEDLDYMADFFRERLADIKMEELKNNRNISKTSEKLQKYQHQLKELYRRTSHPTSQITVTVSSPSEKDATLNIEYVVANAGWYPLYDFRAKDTKSFVQLSYKAHVYQSTGIDWENVKLKLSTSNPSLGGTKPELSTWHLDIYEPRPTVHTPRYKKEDDKAGSTLSGIAYMEEEGVKAASSANHTKVVETTLAAEFDIALPYTIPSDGVEQLIEVQNHQLPATYIHSAVPKIDKDAFLVARVTGWDELSLISGNANIYFEGTYVGQSFLNMQNTNDTLQLSLGRDNKVVIEREKLKDFSSKKLIGSNRKEDYAFEITVRNSKKDPIEIILEDQMPVSQNSEIEVEWMDAGGAEYDLTTGKLVWKLRLNSTETKSVTFKYAVKYPKNKNVKGLY